MERKDLLTGLNDSQREAVLATQGPLMIIAGAGSGKTRVLTHRLAHIIQERLADSFNLLALTFTNKAAREMRERITKLVGPEARNIQMGTFHSIFSRILRVEAERIGYTSAFTIYDTDDSVGLIRTLLKEKNLDDKKFKPKSILNNISGAKNNLIDARTFELKYATDEYTHVAAQIYKQYQERLVKANAMDFDDLLFNMVVLFRDHPDALHKYQHKFKYVMVDEYQDTNHAQYMITKKLAAVHENICVVGDDAQSIYSFRGADITNILNFRKDYPDAKIIKLEQNYRSTKTIVEAANDVIRNNTRQLEKKVFTANETGELIRVTEAPSDQEEARLVVDNIRELRMVRGLQSKDMAILYRTNAQSRVLEDGLRRAGIRYRIYGGLSFYGRKEIKDMVAYLRLAINPADEEAIKRVINYPMRGIGDTSVQRLIVLSDELNCSLWEATQQAGRATGTRLPLAAIEQFTTLVKSFQTLAKKENAWTVVEFAAKQSGILKELHKDNSTEGLSRFENVQELINAAREFVENEENEDKSLHAFISEIALYTDADQNSEEGDDNVTLMTVHSSKGLEFKAVFVVGLEEGLFPSGMALQDRDGLEEERRLFYVAITRAEKYLSLSSARMRFRFGQIESMESSRFLEEISPNYLKISGKLQAPAPTLGGQRSPSSHTATLRPVNAPAHARPQPAGKAMVSKPGIAKPAAPAPVRPVMNDPAREAAFVAEDMAAMVVGSRVEHSRFGIGTVRSIEGKGPDRRCIIDFPGKAGATIILKYAKMRMAE